MGAGRQVERVIPTPEKKKRGIGCIGNVKKRVPIVVPLLNSSSVEESLQQISKRIPQECLASFSNPNSKVIYTSVMLKLVEETIPEGSTILQILVAERCAYFWTMANEIERDPNKDKKVDETYKMYVSEFNRNLEILRGLAIRNLPATQVRLLAKKTINVIERIVTNAEEKDKIISEIVQEFTIEVSSIGFKKETEVHMPPSRF